jgi:tetratricopeptide (TPR) repeat protein
MTRKSSARRPRWLYWAAVLAVLAAGAVAIVRSHRLSPEPTWAEIQRTAALGRSPELEQMLERWVAVHPTHGEGLIQLAALKASRGALREAIEQLEHVPEASRSWGSAQVRLAELYIQDRQAAAAETVCRRLAKADPRALPPRQRLIYLLSMQQRPGEARDVLWQIEHIQNDPRVLVDLVLDSLLEQQDVRGIAPELEEFLRRTPDDPFLRRAWGLALLYQGKAAEALNHLSAAARSLENDPVGRLALAECQIVLGRSINVDETLGLRPDQPGNAASWLVVRARLEEALGQPEAAIGSLTEALRLQSDVKEGHFRLGHLLVSLGRKDEARPHLAIAAQQGERLKTARREHERVRRAGLSRDAGTFLRLGQLCLEAGLVREAEAWFDWTLTLDADRVEAKAGLAEISRRQAADPGTGARPVLRANVASTGGGDSNGEASSSTAPPRPVERSSAIRFEDVAQAAGVQFQYDSGATSRHYLADTMGGGVGLIDFDDDGWLDIYLVNGCPVPWNLRDQPRPNRLYRNQGDGTFRDVTDAAGVAGRGYGMGCAVGDYDGDGYDDLFVTGLDQTILYRNRGDGTFEDVTARAGVASDRWTTAAGFGDLDGDGHLDLVVITYVKITLDDELRCRDHAGQPIHCSPARYAAQADLMFRNNGNGTFTEVSRSAGFEGPEGRGLGLAIADLDEDGKLDIFVANDASPNFLFRNLGGFRFEETGATAGVATNGSGRATASMGVVADDLDGDGRIDLFITNLVNESCTLLRNLGNGLFQDVTLGAGLDAPSRPKTGFGDAALDADNDGTLDLFAANGHVDDRPWANSPMAQTPLFFQGRGGGRFSVVRPEVSTSYLARQVVGRGVARGDLDNDGRPDLLVVHRDAPLALLANRSPGGHWLGVKLRGTRSGRTPTGARVTCRTRSSTLVRWVTSGTGYLSAHDPRLWFGLGSNTMVESLEVRWPSGRVQLWTQVAGDRILEIEEGREAIGEAIRNRKSGPGSTPGTALH